METLVSLSGTSSMPFYYNTARKTEHLQEIENAFKSNDGSLDHLLYHDAYIPGQILYTGHVPASKLAETIHLLGGDKRIKTTKRALEYARNRDHVRDLIKTLLENPKKMTYRVYARTAAEHDAKVEWRVVIVPKRGLTMSYSGFKTALQDIATSLNVPKTSIASGGSLFNDVYIINAQIAHALTAQFFKVVKQRGMSMMLSVDMGTITEEEFAFAAKDVVGRYVASRLRQAYASTELTPALQIIQARVGSEKTIYPIKAVISAWQSPVNRNVSKDQLKKWLNANFTSAKMLGMFALGEKPVFGEDHCVFEVEMTKEQAVYYAKTIRVSNLDTDDDVKIKEYFNNLTSNVKDIMFGHAVAPSGKQFVFIRRGL
jgi:hypothetical protein